MVSPHPQSAIPHDATPALTRTYAWFSAVNANDMTLLEDLMVHGVPVDTLHPLRHTTALMEATRLGRTATVEWLIARGAAPAFLCGLPKGSSLHCALRRKQWAIANLMIERMESTAVIDAYGGTPLHALCVEPPACEEAETLLNLAHKLITKGCPLDALDHEGTTALHHCVINDAQQLADLLLSCGANPNALIPDTRVGPLMIAALDKNLSMARLLLRYGASPHLKTREGLTAAGICPAILVPAER
jgi:ankyrin repeat protein